jgi:transcriptional antiterminator NusG
MEKSEGPAPYWYILETKSGQANAVAAALKGELASLGLDKRVLEIKTPPQPELTPSQEQAVGDIPGFFLVRMRYSPPDWQKLRAFPGIIGFLGERNVPTPLTDRELAPVCKHMLSPKRRRVVRVSGSNPE